MSGCGLKPSPDGYNFKADYRLKPITEKCWSHRNNQTVTMENSKIVYYETEIEKVRKYDARCHSKVPQYTNQTYGWLPGYKILFLQHCDLNIYQSSAYQKVAKDLLQQHLKDQKTLTDHCACKKLLNSRDHWKIV